MTGLEPAQLAGLSALVAFVATIAGAVTIVQFFRRGGRWGWWNDVFSIVLMAAMIPVALVVGAILSERFTTTVLVVTAVGIVGMLVAGAAQLALVVGARTYEQIRLTTLVGGAIVGLWYVLVGALAPGTVLGGPIPVLALVSGIGFIGIWLGVLVAGERHAAAWIPGLLLFVASLAFLAIVGVGLLGGSIVVPSWNA